MLNRLAGTLGRRTSSEAILADVFDSLPAPRVITDTEGGAVMVNLAFGRHFGTSHGTPMEAMAARLGDERDTESLSRLHAGAAAGNTGHAELSCRTGTGRTEWWRVTADPVRRRPGYVLWSLEDITARHEMEQVIGDEQRRLFDYLENAPIGFYSVDHSGRFQFVNHTLAAWLGARPEEIVANGVSLHDVVADPLPDGTPPYDPFGAGAEKSRGEVALRGPDGATFQADISQSLVGGDDTMDLRTRSVVRDLTPEREMARALRQSEQRFRNFFEEAPVGIALLAIDGRLIECNEAFRAIVGGPDLAALADTCFADLISEDDRPRLSALLERAAAAGPVDLPPLEVRLAGPEKTMVTLYAGRHEARGGDQPRLIVHALDTTEQKSLEIQFAHSQKMQAVGQLAGGIAHDFNNLLTAMIGYCDLLLLRHRAGEQSFADLMHIKNNANRAANLVRQLLAFSRQQTLQPKVLNITDVLGEFTHLLRRLIGENIELKMIHGRDLAPVRGDQGQIEQVIINLAVNARDAMPGGGTLTIRTSNVSRSEAEQRGPELLGPGEYVCIQVIDTGEGISKEDMDRIFEPFFSTKEVGQGTGLGLSTVYGIVKQTGGHIFVDSGPREGACFSIFLPRHQAREGAERVGAGAEEVPRDLSGAGTVLLVEDEDPVRMFGARALRNKGYKVYEAKTGAAALGVLQEVEDPIDLLITDVIMPEMDGPTLIREVRARAPETKIICISGYAEDAFRKRIDRWADVHFLAKPFSLSQLAGAVKEVLRTTP